MPAAGFRVEGLAQVVRALRALGVDVDDLKAAFAKIAELGAQLAAGYAPKRTGTLAGSIRGNKARSKAVVTAGRATVPYAGAINYGWPSRGIEPSYYMQRADAQIGVAGVQLLEDEINAAIRRRGL